MRKRLSWVFALVPLVLGCAANNTNLEWPEQDPNLIAVSYSIADSLISRLKTKPIPFSPILVASFVELGKAERSTNFGRMMSDFIASRLSTNGFQVVEMKAGDQVRFVRNSGDLLLSKEGMEPPPQRAQAIVVGTYTKVDRGVYVSVRIVRADNQQIVSSVDLHLPLSYELMFLL